MTIQVNADGESFLVEFTGAIDVGRMDDGSTVRIASACDRPVYLDVSADAERLTAHRAECLDVQRKVYEEHIGGFKGFQPSTQFMWVYPMVRNLANNLGLDLYHAATDEMIDDFDPTWHKRIIHKRTS